MQPTILIVGCGDLGSQVAHLLLQDGMHIIGLRRSNKAIVGATIFQADVTQPDTLTGLAQMNPDILLYCVAADVHSDASYQAHYVDGLHNILQSLQAVKRLRHVFFVSSSSVYGQQVDEVLDESTPAQATNFSGERMLQAERFLTERTYLADQVQTTILRFSGIYGPGRTRMLKLATHMEQWPASNGWTNRIHRDDGAGFIHFLMQQVLRGKSVERLYIVTDSLPVPQYEVLQWIALQSGMDVSAVKVPPVQGNKRLSNRRLLNSGYQLTYPDYRAGYQSLLDAQSNQA